MRANSEKNLSMDGLLYLWPYALTALLTSVGACGLLIYFSKSIQISARIDKRRHHGNETPLLGGMGVILGAITAGSAIAIVQPELFSPLNTKFILFALLTAAGFGAIDDLYELSARWKFLSQNLITLFMMLALSKVDTPVDNLFGPRTPISYGIEWFWCLGLLNSINLIDGMDGLASGIGLIVTGFLCLSNHTSQPLHFALTAVAAPAILGFYFWNFNPAKIFLGESGALSIGIILFAACMTYEASPSPAINIVVPLFAIGLPIFDTLLAIVRRLMRKSAIMAPDREHIHHRLQRLGLSHKNTVRFLHMITAYLCFVGYNFSVEKYFKFSALVLVLGGLSINAVLLMIAERKIFTYLVNFATHILKALDENRQDSFSVQYRINSLQSQGIPFVTFKLNLESSLKSLLEKSPAKIQKFYGSLGEALRQSKQREVFFQNSTRVVIVHRIELGDDIKEIEPSIRRDLENMENSTKIDLYLQEAETLQKIEVHPVVPAAAKVTNIKTGKKTAA